MKNLLFTAWMLLFPIAINYATLIIYKAKMKPMPDLKYERLVSAMEMCIWLGVGYLLYNN